MEAGRLAKTQERVDRVSELVVRPCADNVRSNLPWAAARAIELEWYQALSLPQLSSSNLEFGRHAALEVLGDVA